MLCMYHDCEMRIPAHRWLHPNNIFSLGWHRSKVSTRPSIWTSGRASWGLRVRWTYFCWPPSNQGCYLAWFPFFFSFFFHCLLRMIHDWRWVSSSRRWRKTWAIMMRTWRGPCCLTALWSGSDQRNRLWGPPSGFLRYLVRPLWPPSNLQTCSTRWCHPSSSWKLSRTHVWVLV